MILPTTVLILDLSKKKEGLTYGGNIVEEKMSIRGTVERMKLLMSRIKIC